MRRFHALALRAVLQELKKFGQRQTVVIHWDSWLRGRRRSRHCAEFTFHVGVSRDIDRAQVLRQTPRHRVRAGEPCVPAADTPGELRSA